MCVDIRANCVLSDSFSCRRLSSSAWLCSASQPWNKFNSHQETAALSECFWVKIFTRGSSAFASSSCFRKKFSCSNAFRKEEWLCCFCLLSERIVASSCRIWKARAQKFKRLFIQIYFACLVFCFVFFTLNYRYWLVRADLFSGLDEVAADAVDFSFKLLVFLPQQLLFLLRHPGKILSVQLPALTLQAAGVQGHLQNLVLTLK